MSAAPADVEAARAFVKRVLVALTGLDRGAAEYLVAMLEMNAAAIKGMAGTEVAR